jgi:mannose-6-phosphate isomerase
MSMNGQMVQAYPLVLQPRFYEKVWGGRGLAQLGKAIPAGANIGESWELADMPRTSASGAGGGAARSVVDNGVMAGRTLSEVVSAWGEGLLGPSRLSDEGGFPLLVKFLDARENLSVQVHPSPAYAAAHPGAKLKTECWYILGCEPGAVIYKGIKPGVTREQYARAIADNTVMSLMIAEPAVVGECHNLPSGTCHALGAGVLVAEVQTPSDTTFRVFDWGRVGRELHVEPALACIDFPPVPAPRATKLREGEACARLVTTEFFTLDQARPGAGEALRIGYDGRCFVLMVLAGGGVLRDARGGSRFAPVRVSRGQTVLIPASIAGETDFVADGACDVLRACVL